MHLEDYGFVPVGEWRLKHTVKSGITFRLDRSRAQACRLTLHR
jgi:hypothetical protein